MLVHALTVTTETAWAAGGGLFVAGLVVGLGVPAALAWLDDLRQSIADLMYSVSGWLIAAVVVALILLATGTIQL
jgi:hypothetical protein